MHVYVRWVSRSMYIHVLLRVGELGRSREYMRMLFGLWVKIKDMYVPIELLACLIVAVSTWSRVHDRKIAFDGYTRRVYIRTVGDSDVITFLCERG